MFDIGLPELMVLGMLALIVFGPERLPQMASQLAQLVNSIRRQAASASSELKGAADVQQFTSIASDLKGMTPRALVGSALTSTLSAPAQPVAPVRVRAVFDPDAI